MARLRYYHRICPEGLRKTMHNFSQNDWRSKLGKQQTEQTLLLVGGLVGILFVPEDGSSKFLRNVSTRIAGYMK
jgi:hypothetical protein